MGVSSSAQSGKYNTNSAKENKAVQDDARSYRSKIGATKLILKNANIKEKFVKQLENDGKQYVIDYYDELDKLKRMPVATKDSNVSNVDEILQNSFVREIMSILRNESYISNDEKLNGVTHSSLQPMKMLDTEQVNLRNYMKMIISCQENLLMLVIPHVEAFIISKEFLEAKKVAAKTSMRRKSSFKLPTLQPIPKTASSDSLQSSTSIDRMDTVDVLESIERTMNPSVAKSRPSLFQSFRASAIFPENSSKSTFDSTEDDEAANDHDNGIHDKSSDLKPLESS